MRPDVVETGMEPVHLLSDGVREGGGGEEEDSQGLFENVQTNEA